MRKITTMALLGSILFGGAALAASLDAKDKGSPGSMMGRGTVGDGESGGMMKMMQQMTRMVDHCNGMMSDSRPNDQWRKKAPTEPDQRG